MLDSLLISQTIVGSGTCLMLLSQTSGASMAAGRIITMTST